MPKPTVLVCDDEENIRKGVKLILERDCELVFAADGEECLKQLNSRAFDLVILDIKLPNVSGLDILHRLMARPTHPPVIMLTAYQSVDIAKRATYAGAVDYVTKPFEREALLNAVDRALNLKPWQKPGPKEPSPT
jgi:DNA-binding NtrC family response regulator